MSIKSFELIEPTEENEYCVFDPKLENNPNVFFHMTEASNLDAIIHNGFKSAKDLGVGDLGSVSYANKSSGCFANLGCTLQEEHFIFVVRFTPDVLKLNAVIVNLSDIHVYESKLQPKILGGAHVPPGFSL